MKQLKEKHNQIKKKLKLYFRIAEKNVRSFIFTHRQFPELWREWAGFRSCHFCWAKWGVDLHQYTTTYIEGRRVNYCKDCSGFVDYGVAGWAPVVTPEGRRAAHWRDIQTRVRTHEGELLTGKAGLEYQNQWSEQMLGRNLGATSRADQFMVDNFQRQQREKRY